MKKFQVLLAIVAVLVIAGCSGGAGKVLVKVNGDEITEGDIKFLGEINPRIQAQIDNPAGRKQILDNLIEQELFYKQAVKEGLARDPKVKAKAELYKKVIIAQALMDFETEKAAKKYYDDNQAEFQKLKLSDIAIKYLSPDEMKKAKKGEKVHSEAEALKLAEEVKAKLDTGGDFAALAKEFSEDPLSKAKGGDLGLVSKGDKRFESRGMGPVLEKAFEIKVGEVAGPIKTDNSYHIITVTRGVEPEAYEEAKQMLIFKVRNDIRQKILADLKKDAKITYPEEEKAAAEAKKKAEETAKAEGQKAPVTPEQAQAAVKASEDTVKQVVEEGKPSAAPAPAEKKK